MMSRSATKQDRPVLRRLSLSIDTDDRIALLGANGNGKSTFVKLVAGRLAPMRGRLTRAERLKVAYFAQHQLDELDPSASAYLHIRRLMPDATEPRVRARAGAIGFPGEMADTAVGKLSGGEKSRLLLGLATFDGAHLLILDEPTNHLDIDSRAALIEAINAYPGAVILVSHDRYLIEACADRLWLVGDGAVTPFDGDLDDYRRLVLSDRGGEPKRASEQAAATRQPCRAAARGRREAGRAHAAAPAAHGSGEDHRPPDRRDRPHRHRAGGPRPVRARAREGGSAVEGARRCGRSARPRRGRMAHGERRARSRDGVIME